MFGLATSYEMENEEKVLENSPIERSEEEIKKGKEFAEQQIQNFKKQIIELEKQLKTEDDEDLHRKLEWAKKALEENETQLDLLNQQPSINY